MEVKTKKILLFYLFTPLILNVWQGTLFSHVKSRGFDLKMLIISVVEYYSKFPEMIALPDKTFARFGIPHEVLLDNMPFQSKKFLMFSEDWGFKTTFQSSSPE